jgi:hypothetical protein
MTRNACARRRVSWEKVRTLDIRDEKGSCVAPEGLESVRTEGGLICPVRQRAPLLGRRSVCSPACRAGAPSAGSGNIDRLEMPRGGGCWVTPSGCWRAHDNCR